MDESYLLKSAPFPRRYENPTPRVAEMLKQMPNIPGTARVLENGEGIKAIGRLGDIEFQRLRELAA